MTHEQNIGPFFDPEPKPCCKHLRSKTMYYRGDERPGRLVWSNTLGYWCLRTNDPVGPDDKAAIHPKCQPGRGCYECAPSGARSE